MAHLELPPLAEPSKIVTPAPRRARIATMIIAFNKPYGVISQFTPEHKGQSTLGDFGMPQGVYPLGRLDLDSEGLLLLSDEAGVNQRLLHPRQAHRRRYWAQVERQPSQEALLSLSRGIVLAGRKTLPSRCWLLEPQPLVPERAPPIRFRKSVPAFWIGLELIEGKNRQVRKMTAAVGHPTLRLIRVQIGQYSLDDLPPGTWKVLNSAERVLIFQ